MLGWNLNLDALILPTRDGNYLIYIHFFIHKIALILPTRDGNDIKSQRVLGCLFLLWSYLQGMETLLPLQERFGARLGALILPTRDGNHLYRILLNPDSYEALILPTRDGNMTCSSKLSPTSSRLWSYLQGMETNGPAGYIRMNRLLWSYLQGMETNLPSYLY